LPFLVLFLIRPPPLLSFSGQREPCRYPDNKVTVIAGIMAMHRWTSVFFGSGEEDEQR